MDYIDSVRKQLVELKDLLELNKAAVRERSSVLQDATKSLLALSEGQDQSLKALYELPRILQSVLANDSVGALILAADGRVLLFNGAAQKLFGDRLLLDEVSKFDCEVLSQDGITKYKEEDLPWVKALTGKEVRGERIYLPPVKTHRGSWLSLDAIPLFGASKEQIGGAVVLAVDITEPLQVDSRVKAVLSTLSQHIMTIECAQSELKRLAEKLGTDENNANAQEITLEPDGNDTPKILPTTIPAWKSNHDYPSIDASLKDEATALIHELVKGHKEPERNTNKKILIVDDLAVNQKLLQLDLEAVGYETDIASNGHEAVELVAKNSYLTIFMDCDMPVMNGYEATAIIRETERGGKKHVPIVAMTAYDRNGDRERCYEIGMDYYLTKGVGIQEILAVLDLCSQGQLSELREIGALEMKSAQIQTPELSRDTTTVAFNMEALLETYGQDEAAEIANLFFSTSSSIINMLDAAIGDHNSSAVNHLCYSLKGPCASMSLPHLVRLSVDIASYAALGRWTEARESFNTLFASYDQIQAQFAGCTDFQPQAAEEKEVKTIASTEADIEVSSRQSSKDSLEAVLAKLTSLKESQGIEGTMQLLDAYEHDLRGAEEKIKSAILKKDSEALKAVCHLLAGCFKSLHAKEAAKACSEMGELAARDSWQQAAERYTKLVLAVRTVSNCLLNFRKSEIEGKVTKTT